MLAEDRKSDAEELTRQKEEARRAEAEAEEKKTELEAIIDGLKVVGCVGVYGCDRVCLKLKRLLEDLQAKGSHCIQKSHWDVVNVT